MSSDSRDPFTFAFRYWAEAWSAWAAPFLPRNAVAGAMSPEERFATGSAPLAHRGDLPHRESPPAGRWSASAAPPCDRATLPKFSDPAGEILQLLPPFYFEDMTTRVLPLRASLTTLQGIVDGYLNDILPPEVGRFRVLTPMVMLMMVNYGKLAVRAANMGWLAQRETLFSIPVAWYRVKDDRWELAGFAYVTPFIFVDSDVALTLGRHVYGWPKLLANVGLDSTPWMEDPRAPMPAVQLSTRVFSSVYTGSSESSRVFLEVRSKPPATHFTSPFAPWATAANAPAMMSGLAGDALAVLGGLGILPAHPTGELDNLFQLARMAGSALDPSRQNRYFDTLNLKQYRDAAAPHRYCYQALTCARMTIERFTEAGLLGDASSLLWDPSGGISLLFHDWPSLPIVSTLGLEVARKWRGDGVDVAEVHPVMPFWYQVDMSYHRGRDVAWRTFDKAWHAQDGTVHRRVDPTDAEAREDARYNATLTDTQLVVSGPFEVTNSTDRVLPLLANKEKLQRFLDEHLNEALVGASARFDLWCSKGGEYGYVYLVASHLGDISSGTNNIGNWSGDYIDFLVPVKLSIGGEIKSLGVVSAFRLAGDTTSVLSGTEVLGWYAGKGTFEHPSNRWMIDPSATAHSSLLDVSAEVMPSLGQGQKTERRSVLQIHAGRTELERNAQRMADTWVPVAKSEVDRHARFRGRRGPDEAAAARDDEERGENEHHFDHALALALEAVARGTPCNVFTLKQVRDVAEPDRARYQSLVRIPQTLVEIFDVREIQEELHVRIQQYPSYPVVERLGLLATLADDQDGGQAYLAVPVRPFWMRVARREGLGQPLFYRAGSCEWKRYAPERPDAAPWTPFFDRKDLPLLKGSVAGFIEENEPVRLRSLVEKWAAEAVVSGQSTQAVATDLGWARAAVDAVEPQMIIERILSREWENRSPDTRWRKAMDTLERKRQKRMRGKLGSRRWMAEIELFWEEIGKHPRALAFRPRLRKRLLCQHAIVFIACGFRREAEAEGAAAAMDVLGRQWRDEFGSRLGERRSRAGAPTALQSLLDDLEKVSSVFDEPDEAAARAKGTAASEPPSKLLQMQQVEGRYGDLLDYQERRAGMTSAERQRTTRKLYKRNRDILIRMLAQAHQLPVFHVRRDLAGDRLLPRKMCWRDWYVGTETDVL